MQDPNEDTEWNDALRAKGILPPKQKEAEITEDQILSMMDEAIKKRTDASGESRKDIADMDLDELDELEDSEDEAVLEEYRRKRLAEMKIFADKAKFGSVREISGQEYVDEVNKAGQDIWVVLHLYANGIPQCNLIHHYMNELAVRFPQTKFLKSVATTCIPNFPERNVPCIFIYYEGQMKRQFIGSTDLRGDKLTKDEFEYLLGRVGAIKTEIKEDPRQQIKDKMTADLDNIDFY